MAASTPKIITMNPIAIRKQPKANFWGVSGSRFRFPNIIQKAAKNGAKITTISGLATCKKVAGISHPKTYKSV